MPVFEYKCKECNTKFDVLHKSSVNVEEVICPKCSSTKNQKLFSSFSASGFSSSGSTCESGNCGLPQQSYGGCSSGMCGLN